MSKRKEWVAVPMAPWGWCVTKWGENFMYAKFHKELKKATGASARDLAKDFAKRLNEHQALCE